MKPDVSIKRAASALWKFVVFNPTYKHTDTSEENEQLTDVLLDTMTPMGFDYIGTGGNRLVMLGPDWVLKTDYGNFTNLRMEHARIIQYRRNSKFSKHVPITILWQNRSLIQERVYALTKDEFDANFEVIDNLATRMNIGDLYHGNVGKRENGEYVFFDLEFGKSEFE